MAVRGCFSLVSWNCNGLQSRLLELREFVNEHNPHIILLQETHLRPGMNPKIPNYTMIRTDHTNNLRTRAIRGTAIFIKNHLHFNPITLPILNYVNATGISLNIPGTPLLNFVSVYVPHQNDADGTLADLKNLLAIGDNTLVIGDYNAHHPYWNCVNSNSYGQAIYSYLLRSSTTDILYPPSPTHFTSQCSSTIDFGLYSGFNYPKEITSLPELSSDHNPLLVNFKFHTPPPPARQVNITDWAKFKSILSNYNYSYRKINYPSDIDDLVKDTTDFIISAHNAATTSKTQKDSIFLNKDVRILIKNKNKARKTWQRTRRDSDKIIMNRAQQDLKNLLYKLRNDNWSTYLQSLTPDDNSIWKAARRLKGTVHNIPPLKISNSNTYAYTDEEKANAIATQLESQFQPNNLSDDETETQVSSALLNFFSTTHPPPDILFSATDVYTKIQSLPKNKAPGISNNMLKLLPFTLIFKITDIINAVINFSYFPSNWKTGIVAPIPKTKPPSKDPGNYRPITLLNSISKLTESFIAILVDKHVEESNILIEEQFGFRSGLSAPHQVYRLVEHITTGNINKEHTAAVFLDIAKAFDKVWINGLIYKLINYNFPPYLIILIFSYVTNRNFHVKVKNSLSSKFFCQSGVPQGSILSPKLFLLYINSMPKYKHTNLAIYADDTAIFCTKYSRFFAIKSLTQHLKILANWFKCWKIAINVNKTQAVLFSNISARAREKYHVQLNGIPLPWSNTCKYLGVILDSKLTFKPHILNTRDKFRKAKASLYPLICRNSALSVNNKLLIYNSYLRPLLTYSAPAWSFAAKTNIKILTSAQNATIRQILDMPYYIRNTNIYKEIKIPRLRHHIEKLNENFHLSLQFSNNSTLNSLPAYDLADPVNRKRPKVALNLSSFL